MMPSVHPQARPALLPVLAALPALPALAAALLLAAAPAPGRTAVMDWTFDEAAGTTLNNTVNTGSGIAGSPGRWDVAITGLATTGSGLLSVRNSGSGGSGTRTSYADFGPVPDGELRSGTVSLFTTFSDWNLAGAAGAQFSLAFIEGNNFNTASFSLAAGAGGLSLSAGVDGSGDGAALPGSASLAATSATALTVRLSVDLDFLRYSLAYDLGEGFIDLGDAPVDSQTLAVNSLRLSLAGDFTGGGQPDRGLAVDRIWVLQGAVPAIPEPGTGWLWLAGLAAVAAVLRRRRSVG